MLPIKRLPCCSERAESRASFTPSKDRVEACQIGIVVEWRTAMIAGLVPTPGRGIGLPGRGRPELRLGQGERRGG
jgi:hypothetical protein